MKNIHTSILDVLMNYVNYTKAVQIAFDVLEFGFKSADILKFDIYDTLADYFDDSKAKSIATECVINLS